MAVMFSLEPKPLLILGRDDRVTVIGNRDILQRNKLALFWRRFGAPDVPFNPIRKNGTQKKGSQEAPYVLAII